MRAAAPLERKWHSPRKVAPSTRLQPVGAHWSPYEESSRVRMGRFPVESSRSREALAPSPAALLEAAQALPSSTWPMRPVPRDAGSPHEDLQANRSLLASDSSGSTRSLGFPSGTARPWSKNYRKIVDKSVGSPPHLPPSKRDVLMEKRDASRTESPYPQLFVKWTAPKPPLQEAVAGADRGRRENIFTLRRAKLMQDPETQSRTQRARRHLRKVLQEALKQCASVQTLDATLLAVRRDGKECPTEGLQLLKVIKKALGDDGPLSAKAKVISQVLKQEVQHYRMALISERVPPPITRSERAQQRRSREDQVEAQVVADAARSKPADVSQDAGQNLAASMLQKALTTNAIQVSQDNSEHKWHKAFHKAAKRDKLHWEDIARAMLWSGFKHQVKAWVEESYKEITTASALTLEEYIDFLGAYSKRQNQACEEAFRRIDVDGSGQIGMEELGQLLKQLGMSLAPSLVHEVMAKIDMDGSGELSLDEFSTLMQLLSDSSGFTQVELEELQTVFKRFDPNRNGFMAAQGLAGALSWLGFSPNMEEVNRYLAETDRNGDSSLDWDEFLEAVYKVREDHMEAVRKVTLKVDVNNTGSLSKDELENALKMLGYEADPLIIAEVASEVLGEYSKKFNSKHVELQIEDMYEFFNLYRNREGLSNKECEELARAFRRYETEGYDGRSIVRVADAHKVLRWYGYRLEPEVVSNIVLQIDVDHSGSLSHQDFRKIVRVEREESLKRWQEEFKKADFANTGQISLKQAEEHFAALRLPESAGADLSAGLSAAFRRKGLNMHTFVRACANRARHRLQDLRHGIFTDRQLEKCKSSFFKYALPEGGRSLIKYSQVALVVREMFSFGVEEALKPAFAEQMKDELERGPGWAASKIEFEDFQRLIGQFNELKNQNRHLREQRVISEEGISSQKVEDFRQIFTNSLEAGEELLAYANIRSAAESVLPLMLSDSRSTAWLTTAIHEVKQHRKNISGNRSKTKKTQTEDKKAKQKEQDEPFSIDFAEFLFLMKRIETLSQAPQRKNSD
eukprot:TRINITY_DN19287_c0_g1_i1.p1 TRINITY_DN19287_c0_g1~~TRINITY_DN19287_c0_g1_i1.p1  ORF type:complete len:1027 (+),score=217.47 TRINITY_DN19287_c0_g1_i1:187-3267(+)